MATTQQVQEAVERARATIPPKVAVVALGGNALLKRGEPLTMERQLENAREAAAALAQLVREEGLALCVTHGNGPQVGMLALQDPSTGLDVLDAESEGQVGYVIESELQQALPDRQVVTLLTQTEVDESDPAFQSPTKPIGPMYSKEDADRLAAEKGWSMAPDGAKGYRRVVASPQPLDIVEAKAIELLLAHGVITICCGGGGIPVSKMEQGRKHGVEAVVDKDAASSLLAIKIKADWLLLLTDADAVYDPEKWPSERVPIPSPTNPESLEGKAFQKGSMGPKVTACCDFVKATHGCAGIGALKDALDIVRGNKGTIIKPAQTNRSEE